MVCGYMKDNDLTEYSALGLSCEIKEYKYGSYSWKRCRCGLVEKGF
jgi:hypothetical protein